MNALCPLYLKVQKNRRKKVSYTLPPFERDTLVSSRKSTISLKEILRTDHLSTSTRCTLGCCTRWSRGIDHVIKGQAWTCDHLELETLHFFRKLVIVVLKWISNDCARKNHLDPDKSRTCALNKNGCFIQSRAQTTRDMLMWTPIVI